MTLMLETYAVLIRTNPRAQSPYKRPCLITCRHQQRLFCAQQELTARVGMYGDPLKSLLKEKTSALYPTEHKH
jgi:hypothetical protein